jgi:adenylate cyclase
MTQRRILVVDDSFIMRRLVSDIVASDPLLTVAGTAENGRVALQMVRQLKPDLVLLDIEMPEMSGLETLRRLGLRSPCPVIVLSSLVEGQSREREEAMRLGAAACIGKPSGAISMDIQDKRASEVLATVRRVLSLPPIEAATAAGEPSGQAPALLEALLAGVQDGVLAFDSHARLTSCNEQARTLMRRPDLQAGTTRLDDVFDDFNAGLAADIRAVLAGGEAFGPDMTDYAAPDGDWHPVTLSARPLPDGNGGPGVLALLADASERRRLRALLERTASAAVTDALLAGAGEASVRIATILFSDIRGYTALAEALGAAGIVALLNEYFSFMADVVRAALGMLDALDLVNRAGGAQGRPPVAIGIGLATGEVVAGAIGSPDRMNYTVIGDAANLASRLEGQTKPYRAAILACGRTVAALRQKPPCRLLDVVRVKGQATPTEVWEIFRAPPDRASAEAYAAGLDAYRAGRFAPAADDFGRALAARPGDAAAAMLRDRCVRLRDDPPAGWDGAWTLTEK